MKKPKKNLRKRARKAKMDVDLPTVSVCTPTFNRRPFIPQIIKCFLSQDYPKDKIEWIVVDDGTDKVKDLFADLDQVKYYEFNEKMTLGKKRNFMHTKTTGDIIVYMDDDDYYPPCRISHAVDKLQSNSNALCAGSSELYIYFKNIQKMYQFGPYGPNHATAGTFAFKRELLNQTAYDNTAALAEEKAFLKDYTVPFVQLDPMKTILVFSHEHNTFDKRKLLENPHPNYVRESAKTVSMFVKCLESRRFFMEDIDVKLEDYAPGRPDMKPDVLKQMNEMEKSRERKKQGLITIQKPGKAPVTLTAEETVSLIQDQLNQIHKRDVEIAKLREVLNKALSNNQAAQSEEVDVNDLISQINS